MISDDITRTQVCHLSLPFPEPVGAGNSDVGVDQGRHPPILKGVYRILYRFLASLARLAARSGRSKDIEIIVLRHQLAVLRRQHERPALNDDDRSLLGAVAQALPRPHRQGWLVTPDTLLRSHRRRIAQHRTQPPQTPGRPSTDAEIRRLIIDMATQNPTWGYRRIHGELTGLGHHIGASTVWRILKHDGIDPAPARTSLTWTQFLRSQGSVACDFACIDTVTLRRYYLLFFIDVTSREVFFAGITANPTGRWTTQQARNLFLRHPDRFADARALVRDRGSQFIDAFDEIFRTEGLKILKTPVRTPVANPTRSPNAGSRPCVANSSTGQSSGTLANSNDSSSTTSTTTTLTGRTAPSINDRHTAPTRRRVPAEIQHNFESSNPPDATDSSTNTEMQPDQPRRSFGHPQAASRESTVTSASAWS